MKEEEIRKRGVFNRYLEMVEKDVKNIFVPSLFIKVFCPACAGTDFVSEFKKGVFCYASCRRCKTLFVNPRPSTEELKHFYSDSESALFWINYFFKPVAEARRDKIFRPRAEYVNKKLPDAANGCIGDIGAGFGIFLEEVGKLWPQAVLFAIEPSPEQSDICRTKGFKVERCILEEIKGLDGRFDLLTAFELLEHVFDPVDFLKHVNRNLKKGGNLLMTTLNSRGFDIQLLWEKSKSVRPPHHLNFFNQDSLRILLERTGFEALEVSTPGKLDWDIVESMIRDENTDLGRFWNSFAVNGSDMAKEDLQDWISRNNMSSHMRILARKRL